MTNANRTEGGPALFLDTDSPVPAFEQIRGQIVDLMITGKLSGGDRLPSVRQLAGDLGIATGTVQRAYRALEEGGHTEGYGRHGTIVRAQEAAGVSASLTAALDDFAEALIRLGVPPRQVQAATHAVISQLGSSIVSGERTKTSIQAQSDYCRRGAINPSKQAGSHPFGLPHR